MDCKIYFLNDDNADYFEEQTGLDYYEVVEHAEQLFKKVNVNLMLRESIYLVCMNDETVEGALSLHTMGMTESGKIEVSFSVAVDPNTRRQGIARALLQHALEDFPADQFEIQVRVVNPLIVKLMIEMGFDTIDGEDWTPYNQSMRRPRY